jgi:hypothetical protein
VSIADGGPPPSDKSIVEVLGEQHRELSSLFERVSQPDEDRPEVLKQIIKTLSVHVSGEKQVLVPVVADELTGGQDLAKHLSAYHDEVGRVLLLLDRRKVNSPDVPGLVTDLLRSTERHVAECDAEVFPALDRNFSPDKLAQLGSRLAAGDYQALSHPHPHIPQAGPLGTIVGGVASAIDRVRDKSADIGRSGG